MKIRKPLGNEVYALFTAQAETQGLILNKQFLNRSLSEALESNHKAAGIIVCGVMNRGLMAKLVGGEDKLNEWDAMITTILARYDQFEREQRQLNKLLINIVRSSAERLHHEFDNGVREEDEEEVEF